MDKKIPYYKAEEIAEKSWMITNAFVESSYAICYLVEGEDYALLIDSILGMVTAELLYRWEPALQEGKMTRIRAELVCEESLYRVAAELGFGQWMRLGKGEEKSRGRERPSILADMVEAVIAAIYLDGGMEWIFLPCTMAWLTAQSSLA